MYAGSLPKNALVHWPLPVTPFSTQRLPAPYRTVRNPLTTRGPPSTAICVHAVDERVTDARSTVCAGKGRDADAGASAINVEPVGSTSLEVAPTV